MTGAANCCAKSLTLKLHTQGVKMKQEMNFPSIFRNFVKMMKFDPANA